MTCHADAAARTRRCADALADLEPVIDTDVLSPAQSPRDAWTIEAPVAGPTIPPLVLSCLGDHGCSLVPAPT